MRPDFLSAPSAEAARGRRLSDLRGALRLRARSFVGTLEHLNGEAELLDPATSRPRAAEVGLRLSKETRLRVRSGRALVRLDDGSDLWLADGAEVDFSPWGEASRSFRATGGRLLALVAKEASRAFKALTPLGEVVATGTAFEVDATDRYSLRVSVLHGGVEVGNGLGRVRVRTGRAAGLGEGSAPNPLPKRNLSDTWTRWTADVAASSSNASVRPAYRAAAKAIGLPKPAPLPEEKTMNPKAISILAVVIALAGGGYLYASGGNALSKPVPAPAGPNAALAMKGGPVALPGGGTWNAAPASDVPAQGLKVMVKGSDGQDVEIDPDASDAVDQILARLPAEKRDKLRGILEKELPKLKGMEDAGHLMRVETMPDGKVGIMVEARSEGPDSGGAMPGGIERDVDAGRKMLQELVASGVPLEQARATVSAALADSLGKQIRVKHGDGAKVEVHADFGNSPDGQDQSKIWVAVTKEGPDGAIEADEDENVMLGE